MRLKRIQKDCYEEELYDLVQKYAMKQVATRLDVDKHRWYERSTIVYELECAGEIKYLGVNCATDMFNENSSWEDLYCKYDFFEMEKVNKPTYVKK